MLNSSPSCLCDICSSLRSSRRRVRVWKFQPLWHLLVVSASLKPSKPNSPHHQSRPTVVLPSKPDKKRKTFLLFSTLLIVLIKTLTRGGITLCCMFIKQPENLVFRKIYENFNKWTLELSKVFFHQTERKKTSRKGEKLPNNIYKHEKSMSWCERYVSITCNENFYHQMMENLYLSFIRGTDFHQINLLHAIANIIQLLKCVLTSEQSVEM